MRCRRIKVCALAHMEDFPVINHDLLNKRHTPCSLSESLKWIGDLLSKLRITRNIAGFLSKGDDAICK